jgi:hypothetical protein
LLVGGEKIFRSLLDGLVKFAIIVVIFAADHGPFLIDLAHTAIAQMLAHAVNVQKPAISILEDVDILVRHLPQEMIEIVYRFRRRHFLIYRTAANGFLALGAFLVDSHGLAFSDIDVLDLGSGVHTSSLPTGEKLYSILPAVKEDGSPFSWPVRY